MQVNKVCSLQFVFLVLFFPHFNADFSLIRPEKIHVHSVLGQRKQWIHFYPHLCLNHKTLLVFDQRLSMSGYTAEYIQEKLKKELNPIHLVRSTDLKKETDHLRVYNRLFCACVSCKWIVRFLVGWLVVICA